MKKYTQKYFRELVKLGLAADITTADTNTIEDLNKSCNKIGYSSGTYGINGGMIENPKTGDIYVITQRNTNLFRIF